MAKMSFNQTATKETPKNEVAASTQSPAVIPPRHVPALPPTDDFGGEWLATDRRLPRINLVQKVSDNELVKSFGIGAFVLAREVRIGDEENPVLLTALQAMKDYVQKVPFDSGEQPAIFKTEEEVINSGGSLNYADLDTGNFFQPRAHIEFAISAPEGLGENELALFPYAYKSAEGKEIPYALALYTVASSAYTSLAKELATMRSANKVLRQGLRFGNLKLTPEIRTKNTKTWYVPVARFNGANAPELIEFFYTIEPRLRPQPQP